MLTLTSPTVKHIKNIPKDVTGLHIKRILSVEAMKAINKLGRIKRLDISYIIIEYDIAVEISKSKTIETLRCHDIDSVYIDEILKSKTITKISCNNNLYQQSKSIILHTRYSYIDDSSTVILKNCWGVLPVLPVSYTIKYHRYNRYNWYQKYMIL